MRYKKPKKLQKGDTIAIVSPSWGGPSVFPKIYENGLKYLEGLGLNIKEYPTARANPDFLTNNPKVRAKDINNAFKDKKVKAIIASIGGDDSVRILPYLNEKVIKANPKILMGYSDTSTLLTYCNQLGLITFHGPAIMAGFSQLDSLPKIAREHTKEMLFENPKSYSYPQFSTYSEGYPDWTKEEYIGKVNKKKKSKGWKVIQGKGKVQGELFGGCIEVLEFMKGTRYWPKESFWKNKLLFLETSEDKPTPDQVKYMLRNYGVQGVYDKINGLIFGRSRDYSPKEKKQLEDTIISIVGKEFNKPNLPILTEVDFGHTDPQIILPLGIKTELDCKKASLKLLESPYSK